MENKGLCATCDNDKGCTFRTQFPVLECEEFTNLNHNLTKTKHLKQKKSKCYEEVTSEE